MTARLDMLRGQDGFTLIEVMVAAIILVIGLLGTLAALASGQHLTTGSQREQQALSYAQSAVEKIAAQRKSWTTIGMATLPTPAIDADDVNPSNPDADVKTCGTGTCLQVYQNPYRQDLNVGPGGGTAPQEQLVTGGSVQPTQSMTDDAGQPMMDDAGQSVGTVHQYVTWPATLCASYASDVTTCPVKRVVVAVVLNDPGNTHTAVKPVWLSTLVSALPAGT